MIVIITETHFPPLIFHNFNSSFSQVIHWPLITKMITIIISWSLISRTWTSSIMMRRGVTFNLSEWTHAKWSAEKKVNRYHDLFKLIYNLCDVITKTWSVQKVNWVHQMLRLQVWRLDHHDDRSGVKMSSHIVFWSVRSTSRFPKINSNASHHLMIEAASLFFSFSFLPSFHACFSLLTSHPVTLYLLSSLWHTKCKHLFLQVVMGRKESERECVTWNAATEWTTKRIFTVGTEEWEWKIFMSI